MKLVLHDSYGDYLFPKGFVSTADNHIGYARDLATWLETNKNIPVLDFRHEVGDYAKDFDTILQKGIGCVRLIDRDGKEQLFLRNAMMKYGDSVTASRIKIVDVDTSKLWKIETYDGAEDVVYFSLRDNNQLVEMKLRRDGEIRR